MESLQNIDCVAATTHSTLRVLFNCTASIVAKNSNLATVIDPVWARRVFPMRNGQWMLSFVSTILR